MQAGFRMSIAADFDQVAGVRATFSDFAESHGVPAGVRRSMLVVLDELLANAVSYALPTGASGTATVAVELHPDHLKVTLTDDGAPFDPLDRAAPDTALSVEDRPIGGLGIHLVRHMVDEVHYDRRDDRNVVVLVKKLVETT
jgi:anti-sigma regulatory factor (Ser/Thr protein kinase)